MPADGKVVSDDGFLLSRPTSDPFCMKWDTSLLLRRAEKGRVVDTRKGQD